MQYSSHIPFNKPCHSHSKKFHFSKVFLSFQAVSPRNRMLTTPMVSISFPMSVHSCLPDALFLDCLLPADAHLIWTSLLPLQILPHFTFLHCCWQLHLSSHSDFLLLPPPASTLHTAANYCSDTVGVLVCVLCLLHGLQQREYSLNS